MSNAEKSFQGERLTITHKVGPDLAGRRLDAYLKIFYKRRSREQIKTSISEGRITIRRNQSPHLSAGKAKPSSMLLNGDQIEIIVDKKPEPPVSFDYHILHEDDALLIVDKPGNLPVHPAGSFFFHTLVVHLRTHGFERALEADKEFFLAHRIDKETSGVIVLTKSPETCDKLMVQFRERKTWKRYLAVVHGKPEQETFEVSVPLRRAQQSRVRLKMEAAPADAADGLSAHTEFKVLETVGVPGKQFSLVECLPKTGRQHQIRVHLAHVGFPIVGDKLYSVTDSEAARFYDQPFREIDLPAGSHPGAKRAIAPRYISAEMHAKLLLERHALHAAGIRFTHPLTGESAQYEAPLRADLIAFLSQYRV